MTVQPNVPAPPSLDFKIAFLRDLIGEFGSQPIRVLDFGCGTAKDWPSILRAHPSVTYTGIEPDDRSRDTARDLLRGLSATVIAGWGEAASIEGGFDLTLSLSVLEHVKYLDKFLRAGVNVTRPGGTIVHRYDLGHALYPVSAYERWLVTLSRRVPWLVPATLFTSFVEPQHVIDVLGSLGVSDLRATYGQMYSLKQAMNHVSRIPGAQELSELLLTLDQQIAATLRPRMSDSQMAHLFPSVTIRGIRA